MTTPAVTNGEQSRHLGRPIFVVLLGLALIVWGLRIDPAAAECGSRPMSQGQVCDIVTKSGTQRRTYDELVAERQSQRLWYPLGGTALLLAGAGWAVWSLRRSRTAKAHTASASGPSTGPVRRVNAPAGQWRPVAGTPVRSAQQPPIGPVGAPPAYDPASEATPPRRR